MAKVTNQQLLDAFERMCRAYGVESAGLNPDNITAPIDGDKYDGKERWAMKHRPGFGWMIVSGWKGCGVVFAAWNGYTKTRRDFLVLIGCLEAAVCNLRYRQNKKDAENAAQSASQ